MKHLVGHTRNNIPVYVELIGSAAAKHISRQPMLLSLVAEMLRANALHKPDATLEYDMGRVIGYDFVVKTAGSGGIFYAQLVREKTFTRFIKNGKPAATNYLTAILQRSPQDNSYILHDVWIGRYTPPWPGDSEAAGDSNAYWSEHACIFENQPIQSNTLTKTWPYTA